MTTRDGISLRFSSSNVDAAHRPAINQRIVDRRVDLQLALDHAGDDLPEEIRIGRQIFVALDLAAEMHGAELAQRVLEALLADIHLVQRLHRGKPRRTALVGGASAGRIAGARLRHIWKVIPLCGGWHAMLFPLA